MHAGGEHVDITQENYRAVLAHQGDAVVDDERDILKLRLHAELHRQSFY